MPIGSGAPESASTKAAGSVGAVLSLILAMISDNRHRGAAGRGRREMTVG